MNMPSLPEITLCEVCGNTQLRSAVDLGNHPMCDDLVAVGDARICKEYPIEILFCEVCRTAHQRFQIPKQELFPSSYHYRSRHTADVLNGMKALVEVCETTLGGLSGTTVLDVGCNDGSLLSFFAEKGAKTVGIEPTGAAEDALERGHRVINDFFSEQTAKKVLLEFGSPDVITFTNVFAHIEDLKGVLRALKAVADRNTLIVIENHYLGAIIDKFQFDTFYHEHPRTYSLTSFIHIAKSLGMKIVRAEFPARYGGNIRVFLSANLDDDEAQEAISSIDARERDFGAGLDELAARIPHWRDAKLARINREVAKRGPLSAKAFPGRAAIPMKMLGLSNDHVVGCYEKPSSAKVRHYVPGSRIPILSDDALSFEAVGDGPLLNLAWHISAEIRTYMRGRGYKGEFLDIISPDDFAGPP
jgi:SAM-dependent methyltransferase